MIKCSSITLFNITLEIFHIYIIIFLFKNFLYIDIIELYRLFMIIFKLQWCAGTSFLVYMLNTLA